jgi:hypothetical protein
VSIAHGAIGARTDHRCSDDAEAGAGASRSVAASAGVKNSGAPSSGAAKKRRAGFISCWSDGDAACASRAGGAGPAPTSLRPASAAPSQRSTSTPSGMSAAMASAVRAVMPDSNDCISRSGGNGFAGRSRLPSGVCVAVDARAGLGQRLGRLERDAGDERRAGARARRARARAAPVLAEDG